MFEVSNICPKIVGTLNDNSDINWDLRLKSGSKYEVKAVDLVVNLGEKHVEEVRVLQNDLDFLYLGVIII